MRIKSENNREVEVFIYNKFTSTGKEIYLIISFKSTIISVVYMNELKEATNSFLNYDTSRNMF